MKESNSGRWNEPTIQSFDVPFNKSFSDQDSQQLKTPRFGQLSNDSFQEYQSYFQQKQSQLEGRSSEKEASKFYSVSLSIDNLIEKDNNFSDSNQSHIQQSTVQNMLKNIKFNHQNQQSSITKDKSIGKFQPIISHNILFDQFDNLNSKTGIFNAEVKQQASKKISQSINDNNCDSLMHPHSFDFIMLGTSRLKTKDTNSNDSNSFFPVNPSDNNFMKLDSFSHKPNKQRNLQFYDRNKFENQHRLELSGQEAIQKQMEQYQHEIDLLYKYMLSMPVPQEIKSLSRNADKAWFGIIKLMPFVYDIIDYQSMAKLELQDINSPFIAMIRCFKNSETLSKQSQALRNIYIHLLSALNNSQNLFDIQTLQEDFQLIIKQFSQIQEGFSQLGFQKTLQFLQIFIKKSLSWEHIALTSHGRQAYAQETLSNNEDITNLKPLCCLTNILDQSNFVSSIFDSLMNRIVNNKSSSKLQNYQFLAFKKSLQKIKDNFLMQLRNELSNFVQNDEKPWLYFVSKLSGLSEQKQ